MWKSETSLNFYESLLENFSFGQIKSIDFNFSTICLLCLKNPSNNSMTLESEVDVSMEMLQLNVDKKKILVSDLLSTVTDWSWKPKIKENSLFQVCLICVEQLKRSYFFSIQVQKVQIVYRKLLSASGKFAELEDGVILKSNEQTDVIIYDQDPEEKSPKISSKQVMIVFDDGNKIIDDKDVVDDIANNPDKIEELDLNNEAERSLTDSLITKKIIKTVSDNKNFTVISNLCINSNSSKSELSPKSLSVINETIPNAEEQEDENEDEEVDEFNYNYEIVTDSDENFEQIFPSNSLNSEQDFTFTKAVHPKRARKENNKRSNNVDTITTTVVYKSDISKVKTRSSNLNQNDEEHNLVEKVMKRAPKNSTSDDDYEFRCPGCTITTKSKNSLRLHVNLHHPNSKLFQCAICQVSFQTLQSLERHEKMHQHQVVQKKCDYCEKTFIRADDKQRHERTHTNERPYICQVNKCMQAFKQWSDLNTHQLVHNKTEFLCHCGKIFYSRNGIHNHKKTHKYHVENKKSIKSEENIDIKVEKSYNEITTNDYDVQIN